MQGFLQVSDIHRLFYASYGNPHGIPVVVLHGGPGAGCSEAMTRFFDLQRWNVIMFDQRGAVWSEPFCCMEENSGQHSVADIERLRVHFGIEKWYVFGGSWGSTLALLYGQSHPERCRGFILRGIFLGREQDYLHVMYGTGKIFPEAHEIYLNFIPEEERGDLLTAYYTRIFDPNPLPALRVFIRYMMTCSTHLPNPEALEKLVEDEKLSLSMARGFLHYAKHGFFLEPDQVLNGMSRIAHLPSIIIHGRWDAMDLPEMAYLLHKNWPDSRLWMIPDGGHSANDPSIASALRAATDLMAREEL